jgi:hypothetical protein
MNKTLMEKIRVYLSLHPETRDCDRTLTTLIWTGELNKFSDEYIPTSLQTFLRSYRDGKLTSSDSITRARRKLQEEDKTLRGEKWYIRKRLQEQFKQKVIQYKYS